MSLSVIVADDEPLIAHVLEMLLIDEGFDVRVARDGLEAWRKIDDAAPNLLVTDMMMPRLDGLALVQRVRASGHRFPIIVISAHASCVNAPGVRLIRKPFDLDDLLHAIHHLLAGETSAH